MDDEFLARWRDEQMHNAEVRTSFLERRQSDIEVPSRRVPNAQRVPGSPRVGTLPVLLGLQRSAPQLTARVQLLGGGLRALF